MDKVCDADLKVIRKARCNQGGSAQSVAVAIGLQRFNLSALSQFKAGAKVMGKERKSNKETKKAPAMTAKEKKAAKKAKKNERSRIGE